MRYARVVVTGIVFSVASFSSCTCQKQVGTPPTFQERPSGFHVAGSRSPTPMRVAAATSTPAVPTTPERVAREEPAPTPPAIPADFPADVPIFKGATVAQVQDLANNAHNVLFTTTAPVSDVSAFYQEKMRQAGWKVTQQFEKDVHAFATFQKGNMIANLTVSEDASRPGTQVIAIMYEEQAPLEFEEF